MNLDGCRRVIVCGGRSWTAVVPIERLLQTLRAEWGLRLLVGLGGAPGADTIAADVCALHGIDHVIFPANWKGRRGRRADGSLFYSAGPVRNELMLAMMQPHEVHGFHAFIERSKGTKHMLEIARAANVPIVVVHAGDSPAAA